MRRAVRTPRRSRPARPPSTAAHPAAARQSLLVQRAADIPWAELGEIGTLGLSAGASAPEVIVDEIIDAFRARYDVTVDLAVTATETEDFPVMRDLRDVELTTADMAFVNGARAMLG